MAMHDPMTKVTASAYLPEMAAENETAGFNLARSAVKLALAAVGEPEPEEEEVLPDGSSSWRCLHPGCERQYASRDAARKHCRAAHLKWLTKEQGWVHMLIMAQARLHRRWHFSTLMGRPCVSGGGGEAARPSDLPDRVAPSPRRERR